MVLVTLLAPRGAGGAHGGLSAAHTSDAAAIGRRHGASTRATTAFASRGTGRIARLACEWLGLAAATTSVAKRDCHRRGNPASASRTFESCMSGHGAIRLE